MNDVFQSGGGGDDGLPDNQLGLDGSPLNNNNDTTLLDKVRDKAFSDAVFERKSAAAELLEAFRQSSTSDGDLETMLNLIDTLANDTEHSVRAIVMEQLPQISLFCHEEGPRLDHVLPQHILPHIVDLLTDKFTQVRKTSQSGLLLLVERGIIVPSQVEEHIIPMVLEFTSPSAHEDYRTEIAQFMSRLAPLVGKDIIIKTYLERFCHLCTDKLFQVRRVCAANIGGIASVVGANITEKILVKHFRFLCHDEVWGVRKGCADTETITAFARCCKPLIKKGTLTEAFVTLLKDSSRWVRVAACQSLGPFIATFAYENSSPLHSDFSDAEKIFLSSYKCIDLDVLVHENDKSSSSESSPDNSPTVISSQTSNLVTHFTDFLDKKKRLLDQNQNAARVGTTASPSADFTVIPMDVDDDNDGNGTSSEMKWQYSSEGTTSCVQNDNELSSPTDNNNETLRQTSYQQQSPAGENGNMEYDTWQFWREPIRDINLDVEMCDNTTTTTVTSTSSSSEVNMDVEGILQPLMVTESCAVLDNSSVSSGAGDPPVPTGVHRSYMNLFSATNRESFEDNGFASLKLDDNYDDDSDEPLSVALSNGEDQMYWGGSSRPRLLTDLPKAQLFQDIVPAILLEHFTALCKGVTEPMDCDILSHCVYNLPAVVLTLGPQNWSLLRESYEALACNMQWKIRHTLASSLHEIAKILGPELSERDLLPFYLAVTKDVDEVRVGILKNLSNFIKVLGCDAQKRCLDTYTEFLQNSDPGTNVRNWRFRLEFTEQIQKLTELYEAEEILKYMCPLAMELLRDRVAEVRKKAVSVIPCLVSRLNYTSETSPGDPLYVKEFLNQIKALGNNESWIRRQAFATLARELLNTGSLSPTQFSEDIVPVLMDLSEDKVPNVRLKVAQTLLHISKEDLFVGGVTKDIVTGMLERLRKDEDRDVRFWSKPQEEQEEDEYDFVDGGETCITKPSDDDDEEDEEEEEKEGT